MLISFYLIGKTAISSSTNDTGFCSSHTVTNNFRAYRYPPKQRRKAETFTLAIGKEVFTMSYKEPAVRYSAKFKKDFKACMDERIFILTFPGTQPSHPRPYTKFW